MFDFSDDIPCFISGIYSRIYPRIYSLFVYIQEKKKDEKEGGL